MTDVSQLKPNQFNDMNQQTKLEFKAGKYSFLPGRRTYLMGILNVTPDSFSDGGDYLNRDQALHRAEEMIRHGVDIIDVGGESTRPGSQDISTDLEIERTAPVIADINRHFDVPVSIDTYKYEVAYEALKSGACIINDVYGLLGDRRLADLAAEKKAGLVLMHNARYYRSDHQDHAGSYIVSDHSFRRQMSGKSLIYSVVCSLRRSLDTACKAEIEADHILLDPGIGFGINTEESLSMIRNLSQLKQLGRPILLGPSRKRFIGEMTGQDIDNRLMGTAAAVTAGIAAGADFMRVHDVAAIKQVIQVADGIFRCHS